MTKLNANQIAALRTSARHHNNIIKGSLRTLHSLERRGLAAVVPGYYNVFQLTDTGIAALAELDARDAEREAHMAAAFRPVAA